MALIGMRGLETNEEPSPRSGRMKIARRFNGGKALLTKSKVPAGERLSYRAPTKKQFGRKLNSTHALLAQKHGAPGDKDCSNSGRHLFPYEIKCRFGNRHLKAAMMWAVIVYNYCLQLSCPRSFPYDSAHINRRLSRYWRVGPRPQVCQA